MISIRLPDEIEKRLDSLAKRTGRSKTFYAKEAILEHLDDLEDIYLAEYRLTHPTERITQAELEKRLGLDD